MVSFIPSLLPLTVNIILHFLSSWLQSSLHQKVRFNNFQYAGICCTALTVAFMSHTVPEDIEVLTARTSPPRWPFFPKSLHALLIRKMENTSWHPLWWKQVTGARMLCSLLMILLWDPPEWLRQMTAVFHWTIVQLVFMHFDVKSTNKSGHVKNEQWL